MKKLAQYSALLIAFFAIAGGFWGFSIVRAAQVTERSATLSSASVSASNVTYDVNFKAAENAGAVVIEFCNNSPLIGQNCTPPTGMNVAEVTTANGFAVADADENKVIISGTVTASSSVAVSLANITNPSASGTIYARLVTYDTPANASNYTSTELGAGAIDDGSIAIAITPTVGVSGTVLEALTFCVSGEEITDDCATLTSPVIELGEQVGNVVALSPGVVSEGSIFTQISTNALSGAVVRLKSNAFQCGGLLRAGATGNNCDIEPALDRGIEPGKNQSRFGVKTSDASLLDIANISSGSLGPASGSFYGNDNYAMNFVSNEQSGVTSTFGDPFLDTAGQPANRKSMELFFAATVNNQTPAGTYSADLSMVAVGKF